MIDPARWERVQALFHRVADRPAAERAAILDAERAADPTLVAEVEGLLEEDARAGSALDRDLAHVAARVLGSPVPHGTFGPYRLGGLLGEGGMGVVYRAERDDLGSVAAIKILRDAWLSPARRERFRAEQRTLAQLNHPSIAQLHHADALPDGTPWFVMEYVEGVPLTDYCREHGTSIEGRLELFRAVCEAVQYAHGQAVIHRDLKPSNILVKADGTVKLLDFGIAKHLASEHQPIDQTRTALRMMTPAYASPEQLRGERVGIHSDIYSLGVILYELLTGRPPFDLSGLTPAEAISRLVDHDPERPSVVAARVTASPIERPRFRPGRYGSWSDLDVLCLTAMHRDPLRRYPTVDALIGDVGRYLAGEPLLARPGVVGYRIGKFIRRHRVSVVAAVGIAAVLVGMATYYTTRLARARNEAVAEAARTQRIQRFLTNLFEGGDEAAGPAAEMRVVTLIERGVIEARSLAAEPVIQAELYETLGRIYHKLGDLDRADELLEASLERRRELPGDRRIDEAESRIALGLLRSDQAQYDEAETLCREGLATLVAARPRDHPSIAAAQTALGHVLIERGSYDDAAANLELAAAIRERHREETPELADTLFELANAHFYRGRLAEAEAVMGRVLVLSRGLYGDRHPHVAEDLVNLGAIRHEQGDYAGAEQHYRDALEINREWYGDDHPATASAQIMLGRSLVYAERFDEAQRELSEALATQERVYGPDHPRVASALNDLGSIALQRDDYPAAEAAFRRTVAIQRAAHPQGHYLVGTAVSNLASVFMARGHWTEAEPQFREAIEIYVATLSAEHLNVGIARIKLGRVLLRQGRHEEALAQTLAGHETLTRQTDPAVSWLRAAREDLVAEYDALGRAAEADAYRAPVASP